MSAIDQAIAKKLAHENTANTATSRASRCLQRVKAEGPPLQKTINRKGETLLLRGLALTPV